MGESSCCSRQGCSSHVPDSAACTAVDNCNPGFVWITVIQTSYLHLRPARTGPSRSRPHAYCPQTAQGHGMFSPQALRLGQGTGITARNKLGIECRAMGPDSIVQARGKSIHVPRCRHSHRKKYLRCRCPGEGPLCFPRTLLPVQRSGGVWTPWPAYLWFPGTGAELLLLVEFQHRPGPPGVKIIMMLKSAVDIVVVVVVVVVVFLYFSFHCHLVIILHFFWTLTCKPRKPFTKTNFRPTSATTDLSAESRLCRTKIAWTLDNELTYESCHGIHRFKIKQFYILFCCRVITNSGTGAHAGSR